MDHSSFFLVLSHWLNITYRLVKSISFFVERLYDTTTLIRGNTNNVTDV